MKFLHSHFFRGFVGSCFYRFLGRFLRIFCIVLFRRCVLRLYFCGLTGTGSFCHILLCGIEGRSHLCCLNSSLTARFFFLCLYFHRFIFSCCIYRYPDFSEIAADCYVDPSILHFDMLSCKCSYIFGSISGRYIHGGIIVIIIYSDDHRDTIQVSGKGILAVGKLKLCVAAIA